MQRGLARQIAVLLVAAAVSLLTTNSLEAQSIGATLAGVVAESRGAVVPGATITVTNTKTLATRSTVSDRTGAFQVANLDAGDYAVKATLDGFGEWVRQFELLARQTVRADVQLSPGIT